MIRALRDTYREAFAGLPRSVWLLALAQFVNRSGQMVLPFLVLWLTEKRRFSATQAGEALALYGVGAMVGAYFGGVLVDRLGPRRVMLASLVSSGLLFMVLGRLESRPAILALVLALSLAVESLRPAVSSALAQCAPPGERVRVYALNRLAINLGMSFGPTIGGALAMIDYAWLFVVDGATSLLAAGVLSIFFREQLRAPAHADASAASPIRSPWRDRTFLVFLVLMTLFAMLVFQLTSTYTLYVHRDLGHSEARVGLLFGVNTLVIVLLEMVLVHRTRHVSPLRLLGPGAFLFGFGYALMPLGASFGWLVFTVLVWTAGEMLALPLVESIVAERADERSRGRYMGLLTVSFSLALSIAPVIGTRVYERYGAPTLWYGCGVAGAALWIAFASLRGHLAAPRPGS